MRCVLSDEENKINHHRERKKEFENQDMLKNYLKIALRNLRRHPGYACINVIGLAIGMACCVLILMYVRTELSYESLLPEANRIYRAALDVRIQDQEIQTAYTARPLGPALVSDFPEVEGATRLWFDPTGDMVLRYEETTYPESKVFFADAAFFDVMGIPLRAGDASTALLDPYAIVLTASAARKYFGDKDPVGETLHIREPSDRDVFDYTVTGVMDDLPATSHLAFDFLASYVTQRQSQSQNWLGFGVYTYVKLQAGSHPDVLESKLANLFETYGGPQILDSYGISHAEFEKAGSYYKYFLQPVSDIHLHSHLEDEVKPASDVRLVYLFGLIGLIVLLLAAINFVNLATARAARRSVEVGVRKTLGSNRSQLIWHFLLEAFVLSGLAAIIAVVLVQAGISFFNNMMGHHAYLNIKNPLLWGTGLIGLAVLVGLGAGAYPAFYLSSFLPAKVLKGGGQIGPRNRLRDVLVVFQFGVATALIACTAVVYSQMKFMTEKYLGFDAEQVVVFEGAEVMGRQGEAFRNAIRALPNVLSVTNSEQMPGRHFNGSSFKIEGTPDDRAVLLDYTYTSYDFVETLGLEVVEGRSLSRDYSTDSLSVLLNEAAVKQLGITDPVGKRLEWTNESIYTIIGVVRDFHAYSLHRSITPMALIGPDPRNTNRPNLLVAARIQSSNWPATLNAIEQAWHRFAPQAPFVYSFLDDSFASLYQAERRTSKLITFFAGMAVLIACIGLFGLSAYMVERRKKEIGLRKVLGASVAGIVGLLSKDFARLIGVGIVISLPLAYLLMTSWINNFAYAIGLGPGLFIGAGMLVLLIAFLTVSFQSISAAKVNPATSLHHD